MRDTLGPHRHPLGLRHVQLRRAASCDGRPAAEVVHGPGGDGRAATRSRTVEVARGRRQARPAPAGLPREHGAAVRVLHARDADDDRALLDATRTRPRARSGRRSPARSAAAQATNESVAARCSGPAESTRDGGGCSSDDRCDRRSPAIGFGPPWRKEDARFDPRARAPTIDDIRLRHACMAILRSPFAHAQDRSHRHERRARAARGRRGHHRRRTWRRSASRGCRRSPTTQAVLAGDKVRFQGQEVGRRSRPTSTSPATRCELIDVDYDPLDAVVNARKALDDGRAADPRRQGRPGGQPRQLPPGRPATRTPTDAAFAEADVDRRAATSSTRAAPGAAGDVRRRSPTSTPRRPASSTSTTADQAPHAHRTLYAHVAGPRRAHDPHHLAATSAAASATRCRSTRATSCAIAALDRRSACR